MNETMTQVQKMIEQAVQTSGKAYEIQLQYGQDYLNRAGRAGAEFADDLSTHLAAIAEAKSASDLFECSQAYQESVKTRLQDVSTQNQEAWEGLQSALKATYSDLIEPRTEEATSTKATKPAKTAKAA